MAAETNHDDQRERRYRARDCGDGFYVVEVLEWRTVLIGVSEEAAKEMCEELNKDE